jgi:hypothetical protein
VDKKDCCEELFIFLHPYKKIEKNSFYFITRWKEKGKKTGENCKMTNFVMCTLYRIFVGRSNRGVRD